LQHRSILVHINENCLRQDVQVEDNIVRLKKKTKRNGPNFKRPKGIPNKHTVVSIPILPRQWTDDTRKFVRELRELLTASDQGIAYKSLLPSTTSSEEDYYQQSADSSDPPYEEISYESYNYNSIINNTDITIPTIPADIDFYLPYLLTSIFLITMIILQSYQTMPLLIPHIW